MTEQLEDRVRTLEATVAADSIILVTGRVGLRYRVAGALG